MISGRIGDKDKLYPGDFPLTLAIAVHVMRIPKNGLALSATGQRRVKFQSYRPVRPFPVTPYINNEMTGEPLKPVSLSRYHVRIPHVTEAFYGNVTPSMA